MLDRQVISTPGRVVAEGAIAKWKTSLRGALLRPGDEGYERARRVWNHMIDKTPALILRCAGVADVRHAVTFARTHHLLVAVRGGGHNIPGNAVCEGGLVIDLSGLKGMRVRPGPAHGPGGGWGPPGRV